MGQSPSAAKHAQNVLYKAIGQGEAVEADIRMAQLPAGSRLVLCSDGLWGMVEDDVISEVLAGDAHPQEICATN
jgi:serine/threonine protein phosphatase PrpC